MTAQEIFDKVYRHLLTQMRRSRLASGNGCAYRSKEGLSCAVGCLIPDEAYSPVIENSICSAKSVMDRLPTGAENHVDLLYELQQVHDHVKPCRWKRSLSSIAADRGLIIPEMP